MSIYSLVRYFLFFFSAEKAHHIATTLLGSMIRLPWLEKVIIQLFKYDHPSLVTHIWGLEFANPIGLAAGFDKDGKYIKAMSALGFGYIEVGTVTPRPQEGNPKPRLFRLKKDKAIINRMGFNNEGVDVLVRRLKTLKKSKTIIGGNIGKNKDTSNEEAYKDYLICFTKLYPHVDYFVVNISSPNTPGLRSLQEKEPLKKILITLLSHRKSQKQQKPILLKISPDLDDDQLHDVIDIVQELNIDGIIATNTTISRDQLMTPNDQIIDIGNGGLSGHPLASTSTKFIEEIYDYTDGKLPIIGVGGINSIQSAKDKMASGASLLQIYSGLIYEGPFLIKKIKKGLSLV